MKRLTALATSLVLAGILAGCGGEATPNTRGVYLLMDTSGTYTNELDKAQQLINVILVRLEPGDSFAVARIDTGSFSEKDIVAKMTFDDRPSVANKQKRQFRDTINQFVNSVKPAQHTDITGGVLQAIEYLNEKGTGKKDILVYSDLKEDLPKGYVRDIPLQLEGFDVTALNVTKLRSDNVDPREYLTRLEDWQTRVEEGGGTWNVINDMDRLERILVN
ncbi:MAG: VWA domain-containing protein [Gammaproteobacteria bacterium]|nr:VWA domain-containing protein [Gammaproteobacteria bacterium]NIR84774.1 VWA domain-containing protein [Gammaproteobacteria bacterium]NIR91293.1 VWA domain-containing protein [Gammaproteobacteria bacterium]NIU05821.1 VWA domain-containing protein [Gammaproteobacteria bacterium]NIV76481.1 VWA domain-containing protein [Gammaproteobacteria bacterium]